MWQQHCCDTHEVSRVATLLEIKPFGNMVLVSVDGHRVRFCVEDPLLEIDLLLISEQEVEVLERLTQEE